MVKVLALGQGVRLPDSQRHRLGAALLREYNRGKSIRQLCAQTGYSIGRVRRLLEGVDVTYRSRGGNTRAKPTR